jgi:glutamine amidotransferase-like uncharacterized protein
VRPYLEKTLHNKGLVEAHGVYPGFKPQYCKKKKKKKKATMKLKSKGMKELEV